VLIFSLLISLVSTFSQATSHSPGPVRLFHEDSTSAASGILREYTLSAAAETAYQRNDWANAAPLYQKAAELDPERGEYWYRSGYAFYKLRDFDKAIVGFQRAAELGQNKVWSLYDLSACQALTGHREAALRTMAETLALKYPDRRQFAEDEDFASLRNDPEFRRLAGLPLSEGLSREEQWRYDLDFAVQELKRLHFSLYHTITPEQLDAEVQSFRTALPTMNDQEIVVGFFKVFASVGDGHTLMFWPADSPFRFHSLPIQIGDFKEGFFVTAATPPFQHLLGSRIVRLGNMPIADAARRMGELISHDNSQGIRRYLSQALGYAELLYGTHISKSPHEVEIEVENSGHTLRETLPVLASGDGVVWNEANQRSGRPLPLWLKNKHTSYWFEYLAEDKTVYLQFNENVNQKDEPFDAFCTRTFEFIENHPVEKLVVDLRNNGGGTNLINKFLIQAILRTRKVNRRGHLFVIVGRNTFSAAMNCAGDLERWTEAVFAGEPSGSSPNFIGDTSRVILPYSGLRASISNLMWQNSVAWDDRTWIGPQLYYAPTFSDWVANRDPVMDAILAFQN
jgi:tetratricopeptide (TPR) repeat protein